MKTIIDWLCSGSSERFVLVILAIGLGTIALGLVFARLNGSED